MRPSGRAPDEMREVKLERHVAPKAEGSCLVSFGATRVLVTASVDFQDGVTAKTVEAVTDSLQQAIKSRYPEVRHLFIEVQSEEAFAANAMRNNPPVVGSTDH